MHSMQIVSVSLALFLAWPGHASAEIACPSQPQQASKDAVVAVTAAVGRVGPIKAGELSTKVAETSNDLMAKLPQADHVYLAQMMFSAYCTAVRDDPNPSLNKPRLILEYQQMVFGPGPVQHTSPAPARSESQPVQPATVDPLETLRDTSFEEQEEQTRISNTNGMTFCAGLQTIRRVIKFDQGHDLRRVSGTVYWTIQVRGTSYDIPPAEPPSEDPHVINIYPTPAMIEAARKQCVGTRITYRVVSSIDVGQSSGSLKYRQVVVQVSQGVNPDFAAEGDETSGPAEIVSAGEYLRLDQTKVFARLP